LRNKFHRCEGEVRSRFPIPLRYSEYSAFVGVDKKHFEYSRCE
jgi:hypothetical protein